MIIGYLYTYTCNTTKKKYVGATVDINHIKRSHLRLEILGTIDIISGKNYTYW